MFYSKLSYKLIAKYFKYLQIMSLLKLFRCCVWNTSHFQNYRQIALARRHNLDNVGVLEEHRPGNIYSRPLQYQALLVLKVNQFSNIPTMKTIRIEINSIQLKCTDKINNRHSDKLFTTQDNFDSIEGKLLILQQGNIARV